jgi:hypothetical protein
MKGNFKFLYLFFSFLLLHFSGFTAIELSDSSRVSLLTCAPGEELYSAFGHNGIRVADFKNDFDVVFNYGTFDFEQPGFYINFLKGKMRYMISTDRYEDFIGQYAYEKRSVTEQQLDLNTEDKKKVFAFLYNNALPENREYYYDFFWDNCATRIRDVFEKILGSRIKYDTAKVDFEKNKTMHDMLRIYVHNRPWVDYGFDLILGMPCEVHATPRYQTFLPDYLAKYFDCAAVDGKPLVEKKQVLLAFPPPDIKVPFRPMHLSLLLVFIGFAIWLLEWKRKTHYYAFDFLLFFAVGLLGSVFLSLWIFSSHYSVPENLNLLWLIPSHLIVSFFLLLKKKGAWLKYYFGATTIVMIVLLLVWRWLPQHYNIAAMPLVFLLFLRSSSIALFLQNRNRI